MRDDNAPTTSGLQDRGARSLPADRRPSLEYARPLVPSWVIALIAALVLIGLIGQSHQQAQPTPVLARTPAPSLAQTGTCGPHWRVERITAGSYTARTIGTLALTSAPTSCAVPIDPGIDVVLVHASGDAIQVSTGLTYSGSMYITAGGWWQVPVDGRTRTMVVTPDPHGGDLNLTIYSLDRFPTARRP